MPSKDKTIKSSPKTKSIKFVKKSNSLDDQIDTKVKISGLSVQVDNSSTSGAPLSASKSFDTPTQLVKEKPSTGQSRMEKIKKDIENDEQNKEGKNLEIKTKNNASAPSEDSENNDYNPEILSAKSDDILNIPTKSNLWIGILLVIIVILLTVIGYWYYQQYMVKDNTVKSESIMRTNVSNDNSTFDVSNLDEPNQSNSSDTDITSQIEDLNTETDLLQQQQLKNPPTLDYGISE